MAALYVDRKQLPSGDNCNFGGTGIDLPSPDQVRSRAERDGIDTSGTFRPDPVRFPELSLICLWFMHQHLKDEVPVPTIYGWRKQDGLTFLYLELINGNSMSTLWDELSENDKLSICMQLRDMIKSWRRIEQAPKALTLYERVVAAVQSFLGIGTTCQSASKCPLAAIDGEALRDVMFYDADSYPAGPFEKMDEFHDAFAGLLGRGTTNTGAVDRRKLYPELAGLKDDVDVVFTHADLDLSNIILSDPKDGPVRVKAIVDWHQSGWYPEPWEWLKAQSLAEFQSDWVKKYLPMVLEPAPYEYFYAWEYISMSTI